MCNAVRDQVACLNIFVWIREQIQEEGKLGEFTNSCLCLMPINMFRDEYKAFEKYPRPSLKNVQGHQKMDGIWNRYNLKSTGRIYTFGVLKCSEKFKVLDFR